MEIETPMSRNVSMTMIYWKEGNYWLGKILEHPEIMTQGETLEELEENLKNIYLLMIEWMTCLKDAG
ncbi:MAG: hypothetical protein AB1847_02025 [bacterium]